jgi:hypothetical protein
MAHDFGRKKFIELHCISPDTMIHGINKIRQNIGKSTFLARTDRKYSKRNYQHCKT